jgi:hypothetical protein
LPLHSGSYDCQLARLVLGQEIRSLLLSPALFIMLVIVSLLVGYSFMQAVDLFSQASRTAVSFPELAGGMNPLEGIFVPTFGAYYLSETLLLPFVAIRLIGLDKQSGALKLLLQLPLSPLSLCGLKMTAMGLVWLLSLLPAAMVLLLWHNLGGHIFFPEIMLLFMGHGLYSLAIISIAMFAATISDSLPTAAMFCLSVTLGSWILDFAANSQGGVLAALGNFSLTGMLRQFENGLLSTVHIASFFCIALLFFFLAAIWLHPGRRLLFKLSNSLGVFVILSTTLATFALMPGYMDVTENQRHSFNPADSRALRQLDRTLTITIHLNPQDSRLLDLEQDVLAKLRRSVPDLDIQYMRTGSGGLFSAAEGDNYGLIEYEYGGKRDQSYSNSQNEILPIIYKLAGIEVAAEPVPAYRGYPLVADATGYGWWFYILLPLFFLGVGVFYRTGMAGLD